MPKHPVVSQFGFTRDCFNFIWRNFHIAESDDTEGDEVNNNDDKEEDLVAIGFERIQHRQEQQEGEEDDKSEEETHQMKNKPIKEDGWRAAVIGAQEYEHD
eukprot:6430386-Ditylum_brightwellii.AAC.1